jgi:hypothetical protein
LAALVIGLCESECDKKYTITVDGENAEFEFDGHDSINIERKKSLDTSGLFFLLVFYFGKLRFTRSAEKRPDRYGFRHRIKTSTSGAC